MRTLFLVFLASPAAAQLAVRAPELGRATLSAPLVPVTPTLSMSPRLTAPSLAAPSLAAPVLPRLAVPVAAAPAKAAAAAPQPVPLVAAAEPLAAAVKDIQRGPSGASQAAPVLGRLFEGRAGITGSPVVVSVAANGIRPALAAGGRRVAPALAEPPAPKPPVWKRAALAVGRTAGFAFSLYGGANVGDIAYSFVFARLGLAALPLAVVAIAASAWVLGRKERTLGSRLFWGGMTGAATFSLLGELLWDVFGSPIVLLASLGLGIAAGLYAAGFRRKTRP